MEYAKLETAALAHVDDSYYYGAYCRKCKHSARLSLVKLRAHLGDCFPLVKVKGKLRCERCSSRQIVITFLTPSQRTGSLAHLFGENPSYDPASYPHTSGVYNLMMYGGEGSGAFRGIQ
jgi:hypothetical protein